MKRADIPAVYRVLKRHYEAHPEAPVRRFMAVRGDDPFRTLIAAVLSARSRDENTARVCARLFERIHTFDDLEREGVDTLEAELHPLGFFRAKTRMLKALPQTVKALFGGRIPDTVEELVRLPGVGRKVANLIVGEAFHKPAICVDVHVQRICNRLGLVKTKTPEKTERELRRILPEPLWNTWNRYLVAFGQTRCLPVNPKCADCPLLKVCPTGRKRVGGGNRE